MMYAFFKNIEKRASVFSTIFFGGGFALIATFISFYTLSNVNWILGDDAVFFGSSALGRYHPLDFGKEGRFFPLGKYDFNLLLLFDVGQTPFAHYLWITITILSTLFLFTQLLRKISNDISSFWSPILDLFFLCLLVTAPCFLGIIIDLIFPERILLLCLSLFMWFYYQALKTNQALLYGLSFIVAVYATYCKEPVFFVFLSVSLFSFIFQMDSLSKNQKIFYSALIGNAIIFLLLYYFIGYQNVTHFYNSGRYVGSLWDMVVLTFQGQKLLIPIVLLGALRGGIILLRHQKIYPFFDGLLFGCILYILAMFVLKLPTCYYFIPSLFIGLPILYFWFLKLLQKTKTGALIGLVALCFLSNDSVMQMKQIIHQNQKQRQEDMIFVDKLIEEIKAGKEIAFYSFYFEEGSFYNQLIDFKKSVIYQALLYKIRIGLSKRVDADFVSDVNKNPKKVLFVTNSLSDLKGKEHILFPQELANDSNRYQQLLKELNNHAYEQESKGSDFILSYRPISLNAIPFDATILFSELDITVATTGLSGPEPWGRWSNGKEVYLFFKVNSSQNIKVNIDVKMPLPLNQYPQEVNVFANGFFLKRVVFDKQQQKPNISVPIPASLIPPTGVVRLRFEIKNPRNLKEMGLSEDTRELGIGFVQMVIKGDK